MENGNAAEKIITPDDLVNYHREYSRNAVAEKVNAAPPEGGSQSSETSETGTPETEGPKVASLYDTPETTDWGSLGAKTGKTETEEKTEDPNGKGPSTYSENVSTKSKYAGKMVATGTDLFASMGLNMIAQNDERSKFKATKEELEEMTELWAQYLEASGQEIPLWMVLAFTILIIYGSKMPTALKDRKANKARAQMSVAYRKANDEVEEVETEEVGESENEEITQQELQFREEELSRINIMIDAHNSSVVDPKRKIPLFQNHTVKPGFCKWAWLIEDRLITIDKGVFSDPESSSKWATMCRKLSAANIQRPKGTI